MKRPLLYTLLLLFLACPGLLLAQSEQPRYPVGEGYYKDIFLDSGPSVTSQAGQSHANYLGWRWEEFSSWDTAASNARFAKIMAGTEDDINGILLFPNGKPRFRMMMIGGAQAKDLLDGDAGWIGGGGRHTKALEQTGFDLNQNGATHIVQFVRAGGGYAGFCAGFLITENIQHFNDQLLKNHNQNHQNYPWETFTATLESNHFGMDLPNTLQLGGGYYANPDLIPGLEEVGQFKVSVGNGYEYYPALWTYEHPDFPESGNLIVSGGHPERGSAQANNEFMAKLFTYAVAGNHGPELQRTLENGDSWDVYEDTGSPDIDQIKIGDGQYHHYLIDIPEADEGKTLRITLSHNDSNEKPSDLHLFLNKDDYAFKGVGYNQDKDLSPGRNKVMLLPEITKGKWYISVKGATYPDPYASNSTEYTENRHVLNGVGYTLKVEWAPYFCDNGLAVNDISGIFCSGSTIPLTYTAADCLVEPIVASLVNEQGAVVTELGGSLPNGAGSYNLPLTVPADTPAGSYNLRLASDHIIAETQTPFTVGNKELFSPDLSATKVAKGDRIRLTWQAGCSFAFHEKTRVRVINQATQAVPIDFYQNEPRLGFNYTMVSLNVDPGDYALEISAGGTSTLSPVFEVVGGNILSLSTDATAFAGSPMNVAWQIDAGVSQRSGRLTLFDANMTAVSVLATDLNLASGNHSTQITINPSLLSNDLNGARLHLVSTDELTQRFSAPFDLKRGLLNLVHPLPNPLYTGQKVTVDYQLGDTLPANETLTARWLDEQGTLLYQYPNNLANLAGTHALEMPLSVGSATKVRLQIASQSGAVQTESALVSVQNAYLIFNGYTSNTQSITWQWVGENNSELDVMIMDDVTYATIAMQTITQNTGSNSYRINAQLVSGRSYSVVLQTKNRLTPSFVWRQFTAP